MSRHVEPHLNASGGCLCRCRRCVTVSMVEHNGHVDFRQLCTCKRCSQDCPSTGRIVFASVNTR